MEIKRHLGLKSYGAVWVMLYKIRAALRRRDQTYKLAWQIDLDVVVLGPAKRVGSVEFLFGLIQ